MRMPQQRQRKKSNQLENSLNRDDFILWSQIVDCSNVLPIQLDELEPGLLYLYEEYAGNGRHRSLEKTLGLRLHSLNVSVPTSLEMGRYFVIPPPLSDNSDNRPNWLDLLRDWTVGNLSWIGFQETQQKMVLLSQLEKWTEDDFKSLSRIFYEFYDEIQADGQVGSPIKRDIFWLGITEPGIKYTPELKEYIQSLRIPRIIEPDWKQCFQELEKQYVKICSKDKILNLLHQSAINNHFLNRLIIFYDSVYAYIDINGCSMRLQIRLQTTRKREFSWRQFWNEMQIMIYALFKIKKRGDIDVNRLIPWYLFAPNQITIIPKN